MDEQHRWEHRFTLAADADQGANDFDVADDLARGRRRLRRRQTLAAGVTALAVTSVVGTTMFVSSFGAGTQTAPQVAGPGEPSPAVSEVPPSPEQSPSPTLPPSEGPPVNADNAFDTLDSTRGWRNQVFEVAASVLDPGKRHLNYSTQSLQSGSWTDGRMHMGIKLGWTVPGQPGEGLVQVMISNERRQDAIGCQEFVGVECEEVLAKSGERYQLGRGEAGAFLVVYDQSDGERVFVYVDPLFGNNALEPVEGMGVTEWDAVRLAKDDRLDLPPM